MKKTNLKTAADFTKLIVIYDQTQDNEQHTETTQPITIYDGLSVVSWVTMHRKALPNPHKGQWEHSL